MREKAKAEFAKNAVLGTEAELMRAIRRGRWQVKEMTAIIQLRKYRQLRQRYGDAREDDGMEEPQRPL